MEEILGAHNEDCVFEGFLSQWESVLSSRISQVTFAFGGINGVVGLILAGSNGTGRPWPLSDIDLIPIYRGMGIETVIDDVENTRISLLAKWAHQGWRTGVDIGRLFFTVEELENVFGLGNLDPLALLDNDRWYHSIDKAYGSRVLIDTSGIAQQVSDWFTHHRFVPSVVSLRLERSLAESRASLQLVDRELACCSRVKAYSSLLKSIQWFQIALMEKWGERDNSLGRFGTRFEQTADVHKATGIVEALHLISSLTSDSVGWRIERAPWWVHERRDRSWKARLAIGERVTSLQNDRDVLRVCTTYELRLLTTSPIQEWLAIPSQQDLQMRAVAMDSLLRMASTVD